MLVRVLRKSDRIIVYVVNGAEGIRDRPKQTRIKSFLSSLSNNRFGPLRF